MIVCGEVMPNAVASDTTICILSPHEDGYHRTSTGAEWRDNLPQSEPVTI